MITLVENNVYKLIKFSDARDKQARVNVCIPSERWRKYFNLSEPLAVRRTGAAYLTLWRHSVRVVNTITTRTYLCYLNSPSYNKYAVRTLPGQRVLRLLTDNES